MMAPTERDVLLVLYRLTDGPNWKTKTNWNTNADLSKWHGVEVNGQGFVAALKLGSIYLRGI